MSTFRQTTGSLYSSDYDVFTMDLDRKLVSRLITNPAADFAPKCSPDSRAIAFSSSRDRAVNPLNLNTGNLYEREVGVFGVEKLLLASNDGKTLSDWSPDGRHLIYISRGDIWALPLPVSTETKPLRVTETPFTESDARVSPDGRWIAYASTESGPRFSVYVQSFLTQGAKQQVSSGLGVAPRWNRNGTELFYIAPAPTTVAAVQSGNLMSVTIKATGSELEIGTPVSLFPIV